VVGNTTTDLPADEFAALRARHPQLVVDLGTGDGKHVVALARRRPDALVVGVDAAPDAMRRAAARAAAKPAKGGLPNAVFVWSAVESLPAELAGIDELHSLMPWGSLLRALARPEPDALRALAARCVGGAAFLVTLNLHAWRPPVPEVGDAPEPGPDDARLQAAYTGAGWEIERSWHPDAAELAELGTSWTKRLGSSRPELAVLALAGRIVQR
jgi:16S rRNA (adenine(1408)-N(1))-methyltransferase